MSLDFRCQEREIKCDASTRRAGAISESGWGLLLLPHISASEGVGSARGDTWCVLLITSLGCEKVSLMTGSGSTAVEKEPEATEAEAMTYGLCV